MTSPALRWDGGKPVLHDRESGTVLVGEYQGSHMPVRLDAVMDGRRYGAVLLSTPGMKNWTAFYVLIPKSPSGNDPVGLVAYDATNQVIATKGLTR
jgi:hypothetical protein